MFSRKRPPPRELAAFDWNVQPENIAGEVGSIGMVALLFKAVPVCTYSPPPLVALLDVMTELNMWKYGEYSVYRAAPWTALLARKAHD